MAPVRSTTIQYVVPAVSVKAEAKVNAVHVGCELDTADPAILLDVPLVIGVLSGDHAESPCTVIRILSEGALFLPISAYMLVDVVVVLGIIFRARL